MQTSSDVCMRLVAELGASAWAFAVLCGAAESGLFTSLQESRHVTEAAAQTALPAPLVARMLDVLVTLGLVQRDAERYRAAPGLLPLLQPPAAVFFLADLRSTDLQAWDTIDHAKRGVLETGWHYTDPEILAAQGIGSSQGVRLMARFLFPQLTGLEERVRGSWAFLDVGAGVGGIAIALCRTFPTVRVVALEPAEPPLAEARRNVVEATLSDRIKVRPQRIEEMTDTAAFDLAWAPQVFLPGAVLPPALEAAWTALRPGGWILLPAISIHGDDTRAALARFRNVLWGQDACARGRGTPARRGPLHRCPRPVGPQGDPPLVVGRRPL